MEHAKERTSARKPKGKHHGIDQMLVRRAVSGGYITKHPDEHGSMTHDDIKKHHVLPDMAALHDHLEEHMGTPEAGEEELEGEGGPPLAA